MTTLTVPDAPALRLTDAAAAFLQGVIAGRGHKPGEVCLLVSAERDGGRIAYQLRLDQAPPDAVRIAVQGVHLAVPADSLPLLAGAEIGFVGGILSIANPQTLTEASDRKSA